MSRDDLICSTTAEFTAATADRFQEVYSVTHSLSDNIILRIGSTPLKTVLSVVVFEEKGLFSVYVMLFLKC